MSGRSSSITNGNPLRPNLDSVAQVVFYRDGSQVAALGAPPYSFTVSGLSAGSYRFHAVVIDRRGATAISGTHTVTVVRGQSPSGVTRTYVYDANQRLCKTIEPETGATVVEYDAAGNVAWSASGLDLDDVGACNRAEAAASGRRVDRAYDGLNRVVRIRFPDRNGDQDLTYRNSGEVQSVTTWNFQGQEAIVNSFQYNKRNLLVSESVASTGRATWSMGYGYDAQGALASMVYPGGLTVAYANNAQGLPLSVSADGVNFASGVRYHPNGAVQSFNYGNGITHVTQLNARQLPYQQSDAGAMSYRYSYDALGNVTSIADLQQGASFDRTLQYDANQRLIAAGSVSFGGDHWHRYSYDARDNLLSASLGGVKDYRYWYDERNRLTNILDANGATIIGLAYDVQGNLRSKNGLVHEFDFGNRLRAIQALERYQYDASGRRAVTADGSGDRLRSFYGQGGQLLYEQRRDGGLSEFIMLGGRLLAKRQGGVVTYQHVDSLGSPVATSNAAGQVTERTQYEPYGQSIGKGVDGVGYTGHVSDAASGLVYMQQRYYDPQIGRFLSVDPVTAYSSPVGAFNRYRYADNSPYNFTDPDGRLVKYLYVQGVSERRGRLHIMGVVMSPSAHEELRQLEKSPETYTVVLGNELRPQYLTDTRTLRLNPSLGIKVRSTGEVQPPAVNSAHEISHAAQHDRLGTDAFVATQRDIQANGVDREENRASTVERQVGRELGEPTRQYYRDYEKGVKCVSDMSSGCGK